MTGMLTVKAEDVGTILGQVIWLVASVTGFLLAVVLNTKLEFAKTKITGNGCIEVHPEMMQPIVNLGKSL